jgi:hypothetical protein
MRTRTTSTLPQPPLERWKLLFEAALLESNPGVLLHRLREAKDAVMDRIEDSFDTAPLSERRLLAAALNTICELERRAQSEQSWPSPQGLGIGAA